MKIRVPVLVLGWRTVEFSKKPRQHGKAKTKKTAKTPQFKDWPWRKLVAPFVGLAVFTLVFVLIWHSLSSPNHGDVATLAQDTTASTKLPEYTTLTTNFYSLNYSKRYSQQPTDVVPAGILDKKVLSYPLFGHAGKSQIEILVKPVPYGGINLDSTYSYYAGLPAKYTLSNKYYHGEAIDIARSKTGQPPEAVGMWLHNQNLLIVKLSTNDRTQNIDSELKDLLSSVQWQD